MGSVPLLGKVSSRRNIVAAHMTLVKELPRDDRARLFGLLPKRRERYYEDPEDQRIFDAWSHCLQEARNRERQEPPLEMEDKAGRKDLKALFGKDSWIGQAGEIFDHCAERTLYLKRHEDAFITTLVSRLDGSLIALGWEVTLNFGPLPWPHTPDRVVFVQSGYIGMGGHYFDKPLKRDLVPIHDYLKFQHQRLIDILCMVL
jgi:hypothetical protein